MKNWYQDSLSYQLLRAARMHKACAARHLNGIGVHPGQETVLLVLSETDNQPMTTLAEALGVKPPTVTKMVARMAGQGLLQRSASEDDGRSYLVSLTDEGREKARELKKIWKRIERESMQSLNEKDRKRLSKTLVQVTDRLAAANV